VVRQFFGSNQQQHVIIEVELENGSWFPLDPSSSTMPAGRKAPAVRETRHSPWDKTITGLAEEARFVGIGALPVFVYRDGQWRRAMDLSKTTGLGEAGEHRWYPVHGEVSAPIPDQKVVLWEGGWWYRDASGQCFQWSCCEECANGEPCSGCAGLGAQVGFGSEWTGLLATQFQALNVAWPSFDALGRTWSVALAAARARAAAKDWSANTPAAQADLRVLVVDSILRAAAARDMGAPGDDFIAGTLKFWGTFTNYQGENTEEVSAAFQKAGGVVANVGIIILMVAGLLAQYALIGFVVYVIVTKASELIDNKLRRDAAQQELLRLQEEANRIIERHQKDPTLPWTDEERELLQLYRNQTIQLEKSLEAPPPPLPEEPFSPWPYVLGGSILVGGILAVYYGPEIKAFISRRR
jgi:peptidoglycan hydrolase-like protein with peptidoglycan-binding domain